MDAQADQGREARRDHRGLRPEPLGQRQAERRA
ncbi:hypothetical protein PF70_02669, partial [Pseudomonas asplenii]